MKSIGSAFALTMWWSHKVAISGTSHLPVLVFDKPLNFGLSGHVSIAFLYRTRPDEAMSRVNILSP